MKDKYERTYLEIIELLDEDVLIATGEITEEDDELPIRGSFRMP